MKYRAEPHLRLSVRVPRRLTLVRSRGCDELHGARSVEAGSEGIGFRLRRDRSREGSRRLSDEESGPDPLRRGQIDHRPAGPEHVRMFIVTRSKHLLLVAFGRIRLVFWRARRRGPLVTARASALVSMLDQLEPSERADLAAAAIATLDTPGLERAGAAWFTQLGELAKANPIGAGGLAAAMYGHLATHRPEGPAPLDHGFLPTEPIRDPRRST